MVTEQELQSMNEDALRSLAKQFLATISEQSQAIDEARRTVKEKGQIIAKLTFQLAYHRKLRYGQYGMSRESLITQPKRSHFTN